MARPTKASARWPALSYGTFVTGTATLTVGNDNTNTTFNGAITGSGLKLVKVGSGTLTLGDIVTTAATINGSYAYLTSGTYGSGNTYTGGTAINGGTISIQQDGALGSTSSGVVINGTVAAPGTLQAAATFSSARTVSLGPTSGSGVGNIDVVAPYTLTLTSVAAKQRRHRRADESRRRHAGSEQ